MVSDFIDSVVNTFLSYLYQLQLGLLFSFIPIHKSLNEGKMNETNFPSNLNIASSLTGLQPSFSCHLRT